MFQKVDKPQLQKVKYLQSQVLRKGLNVNCRIMNKCIPSFMDEQYKKIRLSLYINAQKQMKTSGHFPIFSIVLFIYERRYRIGEEVKHTHTHTPEIPAKPHNIPLNEMTNHIQLLLTWSMLSGMNSPSLLILVNDPFRATWCNSSGMYPGGGELLSLLVGPHRRKII